MQWRSPNFWLGLIDFGGEIHVGGKIWRDGVFGNTDVSRILVHMITGPHCARRASRLVNLSREPDYCISIRIC
jgi:hypothetical protein